MTEQVKGIKTRDTLVVGGVGLSLGTLVTFMVGALIQSGTFTTPSHLKQAIEESKTEVLDAMSTRYVTRVEYDLTIQNIEKQLTSLQEEQKQGFARVSKKLDDLAYRDALKGVPLPPGYKLTPDSSGY